MKKILLCMLVFTCQLAAMDRYGYARQQQQDAEFRATLGLLAAMSRQPINNGYGAATIVVQPQEQTGVSGASAAACGTCMGCLACLCSPCICCGVCCGLGAASARK